MSEIKSKPEIETSLVSSIKDLCKVGLYQDALIKAEKSWGPINTWESREQIYIAIRLYMNLGGDRLSDAIMLKHWRNDKACPNMLNRMLFYILNNKGPILAHEFAKNIEKDILKDTAFETDFLGFKSLLQRIFKNYSEAESLLDKAITIDPTDSWLTSLKIQLLHLQNQNNEAKEQATKHFDAYPSPYNLRVLSNILRITDGADASVALYKEHVDKYQSANVWFEYASLLAGIHEWLECEYAITKFEKIRIVEDKAFNKSLNLWKVQIAIHKQEIDKAIELLSEEKSGYWKIVRNNLTKSNGKFERKVLEVPFLKQDHMTCAPTTIAAICEYWGDKRDSNDIANQICFDGTPDTKERQWLRDNNYAYQEFELEPELAYSLIQSDIPFALVTTEGFSSHIQAVIGYNKQVGTLYIMDPSNPVMQEMLTTETIEYEAYNGARCIAFLPQEKAELLHKFEFPASNLYPIWDEYSVAEQKSDYISAQKALEKLRDLAPDHRITLRVERNFAVWNNDANSILELNNRLLERFPNQTLLLNSKYFCLRDLGRRDEGLALLDGYLNENHNLDLLGTLFDEVYETNDHNDVKNKSVDKLKRYGSYSAYSHWSLANYYWVQQLFDLATEHYLYAYCLDETNSQFVESLFKATRYLKKENESLDFLKQRFEKYKVRSHLPAFSLYTALELLNQEHTAVDYLFEALEYHPDNVELLSYIAKKLIENGLIDKFETINEKLSSSLDSDEYQELIAHRDEKIGDFQSAISFYQKAFERSPYIRNYANSYFRLLSKTGNNNLLDQTLEKLIVENAENTQVMDYIADWHSDPIFREKVLTQFVSFRPDYSAIRRQLVDVRIKIGSYHEALELAKETNEKIVGENINTSYLANCYLKLGKFTEAIKYSKEALTRSVDSDLAFSVLMDASLNKKEKEASLQFVFSQIKEQVIFGDSAWNFWFEAKSILPKSELFEFIEHLLKEYPHLWHSYSLAASFYKQYDELELALEKVQLGIERFPLTPRFYNDLGQLYELTGNVTKTIEAYKQALVLNPAWTDVSKRLCDILEKHESYESASTVIENAIKHNPNDGGLYGYLADLQIKQDNLHQALESLKSAVKHSTGYRWAWNQLISCADTLETPDIPYQHAVELSRQAPYQAHVWRDLAFVTSNEEEKLSLIDKSVSCDPYFIPAYQDKAQYFSGKGEYKAALNVLNNTPWKTELPTQLSIQHIELLTDIGQNQDAIAKLKELLFDSHGYAHLWSKLFNLLEEEGNKADYIDCCHKSVEQNKHDPDILCFVGENLLKHGDASDKEVAKTYLKKAIELSPNDQYTALTYIDVLYDEQDFEGALKAIESFEKYKKICYSEARKIKVLCKLKRIAEALESFKLLIEDKESDYWCLNTAFAALNEAFEFNELIDLFKQRVESLNKLQAYFYIDKCLTEPNSEGYKPILKEIESYQNGEHWEGAFLALLEYWNDNDIIPPDTAVDNTLDRITKIPDLVEKLGGAYINAGHYHSMIKLFERTEVKDQLPAFVYYHQRLALQMLNRWDEATDVIFKGIQQSPDNTVHNLRLWYAYELLRTGRELTYEDIEVIDYSELIDMEKYVYSTIVVALTLGKKSLESKLGQLDPLLRKCQQDYQKASGQNLAVHARKTLKARLKNAVEAKGFWKSLKLSFWISNRF